MVEVDEAVSDDGDLEMASESVMLGSRSRPNIPNKIQVLQDGPCMSKHMSLFGTCAQVFVQTVRSI